MKWFIKCLKQYFDFKGRARRKEFWMFYLWTTIFELIIIALGYLLGGGVPGVGYSEQIPPELMPKNIGVGMFFTGLLTLYGLGLIIPQLAVMVRRLHDIGKPGWWLLVYYIVIFLISVGLGVYTVNATMSNPNQDVSVVTNILVIAILVISIFMLILFANRGEVGSNKYGQDPKGTIIEA